MSLSQVKFFIHFLGQLKKLVSASCAKAEQSEVQKSITGYLGD